MKQFQQDNLILLLGLMQLETPIIKTIQLEETPIFQKHSLCLIHAILMNKDMMISMHLMPNPQLPTNCWEFGTPDSSNTTIKGPYSAPNCWKTKLVGKHPENNESILYSPIFNIGIVKPDTMMFMMRRALNSGSYVHVEFKKYNGEWARLGIMGDPNGFNWYNNDSNRFANSAGWTRHMYSLQSIGSDLGNTFQIRFVFRAGQSVNDGIAIDNFEIRRALRPQDVGVVKIEITPTELPNFGSTYYPKN